MPAVRPLLLAALAGVAVLVTACGDDAPRPATPQRLPANVLHPTRQSQIIGSGVVPGQAPPSELDPLKPSQFDGPVRAYRRYAEQRLTAMLREVAVLRGALARDDRFAARDAWERAYADYLRVGAAYGAFGDLDAAIDGTGAGLPRGVNDSGFTGLHRIERGLWTGAPLASLRAPTVTLVADVRKMRHGLPTIEITPLDYATRAHEILEDAQLQQLTGRSVRWSGQGILGLAAATDATVEVLRTLHGLMGGRTDSGPAIDNGLVRLHNTLRAVEHNGRYPSLWALPHDLRARLNAELGALLEALAGVPGSLETINVSPTYPSLPGDAQ